MKLRWTFVIAALCLALGFAMGIYKVRPKDATYVRVSGIISLDGKLESGSLFRGPLNIYLIQLQQDQYVVFTGADRVGWLNHPITALSDFRHLPYNIEGIEPLGDWHADLSSTDSGFQFFTLHRRKVVVSFGEAER